MTILLVDDHALYRQSLAKALLELIPDLSVTESGDSAAARKALSSGDFDLVLLDMRIGADSGLDLLPEIAASRLCPRVIVVSMHKEVFLVGEAIRLGIQGYVTKDAPLEQLSQAIAVVQSGGTWFSPEIMAIMGRLLSRQQAVSRDDEFSEFSGLTRREQEIFHLLATGKTVEEAAGRLALSSRTVENHRSHIYQKLGLADRHELVNYARRLGLVF